jgi:hypothetical protein
LQNSCKLGSGAILGTGTSAANASDFFHNSHGKRFRLLPQFPRKASSWYTTNSCRAAEYRWPNVRVSRHGHEHDAARHGLGTTPVPCLVVLACQHHSLGTALSKLQRAVSCYSARQPNSARAIPGTMPVPSPKFYTVHKFKLCSKHTRFTECSTIQSQNIERKHKIDRDNKRLELCNGSLIKTSLGKTHPCEKP